MNDLAYSHRKRLQNAWQRDPRKAALECKKRRLEGGIEPLRRQSATGLKPAPQTTEDHPGVAA